MAEFLARRVYEGKLEFNMVPSVFKEQVRKILKEKYDMTV